MQFKIIMISLIMGRLKRFNREQVLTEAIPIFCKKGFAETSLQDIEKATGVNKSGLYSEFTDKEDLFISSLKHYFEKNDALLSGLVEESKGWASIEQFLKIGLESKGCFGINSIREISILPNEARSLLVERAELVRNMLKKNLEVENVKSDLETLVDLILTFNAGLCLEANISIDGAETKIRQFVRMLQKD